LGLSWFVTPNDDALALRASGAEMKAGRKPESPAATG